MRSLFRSKTLLFGLFFSFFGLFTATAQVDQASKTGEDLIQFSGLVLAEMDGQLVPVPYATVYIAKKNRGAFTDRKGFFTLVVDKKDAIRFSCIGFETVEVTVPDTLRSDRYSVVQLMSQDTVMLPQIVIFPWPSKDHFKTEFLAMDVSEEMAALAAQNVAKDALDELRKAPDAVAFSGKEGANFYLRQQTKQYYYIGQTPPMNIFSPLAWSQFIRAWKNGDFKKKDKKKG